MPELWQRDAGQADDQPAQPDIAAPGMYSLRKETHDARARGAEAGSPGDAMSLAFPKPKRLKKRNFERGGHSYVFGWLEKAKRRVEIYRAAGGDVTWFDPEDPRTIEDIQPAMCQMCEIPHTLGWNEGHWLHEDDARGGRRCDCVGCSLWGCRKEHTREHGREF